MHFLQKFYFKTLTFDLINKFNYDKTKKLPKLNKIILNFGSKKANLSQLFSSLLALEFIAGQKSVLSITKKSNISLKIRKGSPVGCKLTLKKLFLFYFFEKIIFEIFPKLKNFNFSRKIVKNIFFYKIYDIYSFSELKSHYYSFNNLPKLDIVLITTTTNKIEFIYFLKSFRFPV